MYAIAAVFPPKAIRVAALEVVKRGCHVELDVVVVACAGLVVPLAPCAKNRCLPTPMV